MAILYQSVPDNRLFRDLILDAPGDRQVSFFFACAVRGSALILIFPLSLCDESYGGDRKEVRVWGVGFASLGSSALFTIFVKSQTSRIEKHRKNNIISCSGACPSIRHRLSLSYFKPPPLTAYNILPFKTHSKNTTTPNPPPEPFPPSKPP